LVKAQRACGLFFCPHEYNIMQTFENQPTFSLHLSTVYKFLYSICYNTLLSCVTSCSPVTDVAEKWRSSVRLGGFAFAAVRSSSPVRLNIAAALWTGKCFCYAHTLRVFVTHSSR
jgi:hypothetical protein